MNIVEAVRFAANNKNSVLCCDGFSVRSEEEGLSVWFDVNEKMLLPYKGWEFKGDEVSAAEALRVLYAGGVVQVNVDGKIRTYSDQFFDVPGMSVPIMEIMEGKWLVVARK